MNVLSTLALISGGSVAIGLLHGAWHDVRERIAPKEIWRWILPVAMTTTFLWYCVSFVQNGLQGVLGMLLTSTILCSVSTVLAFRWGSGGDWRALFYVALLCPMFALLTWLFSAIFGCIQVAIDNARTTKEEYTKRGSPWMISIMIGFMTAIAITNLF